MRAEISKLSKNETQVDYILPLKGFCSEPVIGLPFVIVAEDMRIYGGGIRTSIVESVETIRNGWVIYTKNSTYKLIKLED